jgi:hypothetical protein
MRAHPQPYAQQWQQWQQQQQQQQQLQHQQHQLPNGHQASVVTPTGGVVKRMGSLNALVNQAH